MTTDDLLTDLRGEWGRRKYAAGVLLAFVRMVRSLGVPASPLSGVGEFWARYPRSAVTHTGGTANTLFVRAPGGSLTSLRPYYNEVEQLIRARAKRFDYPACAPHATQSWTNYERWLDAVVQLDDTRLDELERRVLDFVLTELPSHDLLGSELPPPRPFTRVLLDFDFGARRGEATGAAYQGVVYAYFRADAPHLHLDVSRVRTGSRRLQRVGDIDGWEGRRLVLSAEVKHFHFDEGTVPDTAAFTSDVTRRGAMGLIVAESFSESARASLVGQGLRTLTRDDLVRFVDFWDPLKQQAAVSAFAYYIHHVEKNGPLIERLTTFLTTPD